jgi:hypothetical protein
MSIKIMSDVWEHSPSEGGRLLVLLALADHANEKGTCWPKIKTLADRARLSERQVKRVLKELVNDGEIQMPPGRRTEDSPFRVGHFDTGTQATPGDDASDTSKEDAGDTPHVEPSVEPSKESPRPIDLVWAHYRTVVPGVDKKRLTPRIERLIREALEVRELPMLLKAISGLAASEYHRDGGWTAIKYAIGKVNKGESAEDRIDTMAAKAPPNTVVGGPRIDPVRIQRRLDAIQQNRSSGGFFEPGRAAQAQKDLEEWGFTLIELDKAPWVRLTATGDAEKPSEPSGGADAREAA